MSDTSYKLTDNAKQAFKHGMVNDIGEYDYCGHSWQFINDVELKLKEGNYQCVLCDRVLSQDKIALHIASGDRDGYVCFHCWAKTLDEETAKELWG